MKKYFFSRTRFLCKAPILIGVLSFVFWFSVTCYGQTIPWEGKWQLRYKQAPHMPPLEMALDIAAPVSQMLYPSRLTLKYRDFVGEYSLLLVRKNESELAIARNKYPIREAPYSLGPWMIYLNGVFHRTADNSIRIRRMWFDNFAFFMKGLSDNEVFVNDKVYLREFLYRTPLELKKVDPLAWSDSVAIHEILSSDSIYYGIYDTFSTNSEQLDLSIRDQERYDRDTITIVHNGRTFINRVPIERMMEQRKLKLDSGQNYIAFFADNYGELPPNTANFILTDTDYGGYSFNFADRSNAFATLMVASFNYQPDSVSKTAGKNDVKTSARKGKTVAVSDKPVEVPRALRKVGVWKVSDPILFLEFWDDQIQDGDKISILVNEVPVQNGLAVLREPQRIGITLKKGLNRIRFVADNEGGIPPNTAVLKMSSGNKNRLFYLNTSLEVDNVLEITLS
ncbi:hypothetical protein [Sphingobacterium sp. JB170]|uniref:hypothetical protein n=1 Tax=Sphingobacterium sp. JB170 TaxID=1434842 RepID=UPI000B3522D3|nr:hypothetical protein [Sphingobacterium sp. JB170]